jgi:hypothetical protein
LVPIARLLFRIYADKGKLASDQNLTRELLAWCKTHTPLIASDTVTGIAIEAMARPELENKITLGIHVRLTAAERDLLSIGTIRPFDQTDAQFERHRREKRRARNSAIQTAKRRKAGVMPREQYLTQSLSRAQPWEAEGVSRATYYRKSARETASPGETSVSPPKVLTGRTHTCLTVGASGSAARKRPPAGYPARGRRPQGGRCGVVGG